jgi:5'-methylthioadenosine phosphorylase
MSGKIGIIGGSGLYDMPGVAKVESVAVDTPFGKPSDEYITGELAGREVVFLPRHGRGHRLLPSELNFRANIYGFKKLGVDRLISVSAVGSLKEELRPLDVVIPDQFIDRTKQRPATFFGEGLVAHISFADPVCAGLSDILYRAGEGVDCSLHKGGTYLCIEGPQFSTRAESHLYRQWGADVIGMTNLTEAKLAREAELCYATLAMVTDYDVWHEEEEDVTAETIIANLLKNVETAKAVLRKAIELMPAVRNCSCGQALKDAIITRPEWIPEAVKQRLELIVGKYL